MFNNFYKIQLYQIKIIVLSAAILAFNKAIYLISSALAAAFFSFSSRAVLSAGVSTGGVGLGSGTGTTTWVSPLGWLAKLFFFASSFFS